MRDYCVSEKLFVDVWAEYGMPDEVCDKNIINEILMKLVEKSETHIVLDHFAEMNFDCIERIQVKDRYTLIYWYDRSELHEKLLAKTLTESEKIEWYFFGYATYKYLLLDIAKMKFILIKNHLFVLLLSNLIAKKEVDNAVLSGNELIECISNPSELFTEYSFFEGKPDNLLKHLCVVGNLPYYSCVIQAKENIPNTRITKFILLKATVNEVEDRIQKAQTRLSSVDVGDLDGLHDVGNTVRRILEYILKYYCAILSIKIDVAGKYSYLTLGDIRKALSQCESKNLDVPLPLIMMANKLSHDSGIVCSKEDISDFCQEATQLIETISNIVAKEAGGQKFKFN